MFEVFLRSSLEEKLILKNQKYRAETKNWPKKRLQEVKVDLLYAIFLLLSSIFQPLFFCWVLNIYIFDTSAAWLVQNLYSENSILFVLPRHH